MIRIHACVRSTHTHTHTKQGLNIIVVTIDIDHVNKFVNFHLISTAKHFCAGIDDEFDLIHEIAVDLL